MMPGFSLLSGSSLKLQSSIKQEGRVAFRAVSAKQNTPQDAFLEPFLQMTVTNQDWLDVDVLTYGGIGLSLFVFDVGVMEELLPCHRQC
jgi:hypothetical protein